MTLEAKIAAGVARARYLDTMASDKDQAAGDEDEDDRDCIICREAVCSSSFISKDVTNLLESSIEASSPHVPMCCVRYVMFSPPCT